MLNRAFGTAGLLLALLVAPRLAAGQAEAPEIGLQPRRTWTIENGLPQSSVRALAQTPDGALWIGTFGGLARFDGKRFQAFTEGNTPELGSSFVVELLVDRRGTLWVGTAEGNIACRENGAFKGFGREQGVPAGEIVGLVELPDGSILAGGPDGIRRFDGERFVEFPDQPAVARASVRHLHVEPDGIVWAATKQGVLRIRGDDLAFLATTDGRAVGPASYVSSSPSLGLWFKLDAGLARLVDGRLNVCGPADERSSWRVFSSTLLPSGETLIATGFGLFRLEEEQGELGIERVDFGHDATSALFVDREANLWVGDLTHGLMQAACRPWRPVAFPALGLARGNLLLAPAGDHGIWVATHGIGRLIYFDTARGRVEERPELEPAIGKIRGILTASDGTLWVHHEQGVRVVRPGSVSEIPAVIAANASALASDGAAGLWIGGTDALVHIDSRGSVRDHARESGMPDAFEVSALACDARGRAWIAVHGGLLRYDGTRLERWTTADGLPGGTIRALLARGDDVLLGTYGGGIARWRAGRFARVDETKGLLSDAVSCLLEDREGNIWVNGNRGAFRVPAADLEAVFDGRSAAIACTPVRSFESGGRGGALARDGTVCFAGVDGLVCIDPRRVSTPQVPPGIELVQIVADGVVHRPGAPIRVPPGRRELVFTFQGLSLTDPEAVLHRYRLSPFDPDWRNGGREGVARYTSVPPGEYRFEVVARSFDGVWSPQPAAVTLVLEPHLRERGWFRVVAGALVVGIVAWAFLARSRAAERRRRALQREVEMRARAEDSLRQLSARLMRAQEEERRRVALELHDDLGQRLALLGMGLDVLAQEQSTRPRAMAGEIRALADSVRAISSDVHGISHRLHSTKLDKLGLRAALESLCQDFSNQNEMAIAFESVGNGLRVSREVELTLYRIAQEALSNALRHSEATTARVELASSAAEVRLMIEDDGQGFDTTGPVGGAGLGLQGMRERTKLIDGHVTIRSEPGRGTCIEVTVPLTEGRSDPASGRLA